MADISVKKKHGLSLSDAQTKIDKVVADIQKEFASLVKTINWNKEKTEAKVKGKGFSGEFKVDKKNVGIDIDLSFFAKPLKGKIESKIVDRLDAYFPEDGSDVAVSDESE